MAYIKFSFDSIRHKQYWTRLVGNWLCKFLRWNLMENPKKLAVTCCQMQCYSLLECINSSTKCCFWVSESSITLGYNLPQRRYDNGAKIQYNWLVWVQILIWKQILVWVQMFGLGANGWSADGFYIQDSFASWLAICWQQQYFFFLWLWMNLSQFSEVF